ncbi:MAG: KOW domain-containing RNA-binding protein [Peptostreptococcaceae bacterium]|nr:KOW domain-containing RNA-binding protein [Peptostreptococcaceae bacterium]
MKQMQRGAIVKNKAGRDGESYYIILRTDGHFAYVVDGYGRTIQKPKKKNPRHLQDTGKMAEIHINERSKDIESENAKIRKEIRRIERMEVVDV